MMRIMPEWKYSHELVDYEDAVAFMEARVASIIASRAQSSEFSKEKRKEQEARSGDRASPERGEATAPTAEQEARRGAQLTNKKSGDRASPEPAEQNKNELIWLLEHPPLYTAGTSAKEGDLLQTERFPVYRSGRGGQFTYHGPGQRVGYVMLDLKARYAPEVPDLRDYVQKLERWLIETLAEFGITGELREGRVGVWVATPGGEKKIAALGVRVRQGISYHGVALNVCPDLSHFSGIVPCGIREHGVTSLHDLGVKAGMEDVDKVLEEKFSSIFENA